ncbi:AsmA family protein [Tatumella sp. UBA2305]|uniref:AsmA family protein n=1 Tax=Tatumella sp. UBA2305 TaxID=1947647 RepID=UPI0025FA7679|nr:AsmA family protein [Tatumella sp. UBA2305]
MKFIGKFFLILLLILLLLLVAAWFALKSTWGAGTLSRWISDDTAYHLSIGRIRHSLSSPLVVTLEDFTFGNDGQPAMVVASKVTLGLSLLQFSDPSHFDSLQLSDGEIDLGNIRPGTGFPLQANHLYLNNINVVQPDVSNSYQANETTAEITPWKPSQSQMLGNNYSFHIGIGQLMLGQQHLANISARGSVSPQKLMLDNVNGDAERGTFSGSAIREADRWQIRQLSLQNTRFQTSKSLPELLAPLEQHNIQPGQVSVSHATIVGPEWAVTDLNLQLDNPQIPDSTLLVGGGKLSLQASDFVWGTQEFTQPQVAIEQTAQGLNISKFTTHWVNGTVTANGMWSSENRQLAVDNLSLTGLEYTLPEDWRQFWQASLPDWLDSVLIRNFTINNSLVIDINPDFPFQMTALHASGNQLLLAQNHQWGIWSGDSEWQAAEATFNRQDIRAPWLKLHADARGISINDFKMLVNKGPMVGSAQISQQPSRNFSVNLRGQSVPVNMFAGWGWPVTSVTGQGNLTLNATGSIQAGKPLAPTVNGSLSIATDAGTVQQTMQNGNIQ